MSRFAAVLVACALLFVPVAANDPFQEAELAWDRGDYIAALRGYLAALPAADPATLERIALQTGELYTTTEITSDGSVPRISPDGRYVAYEAGTGTERTLRLVSVGDVAAAPLELQGTAVSFSPDGSRLAYLKWVGGPDASTRITVRELGSALDVELDTGHLRKSAPFVLNDGRVVFSGGPESRPAQIYSVTAGQPPAALTEGADEKSIIEISATGTAALVSVRPSGANPRGTLQTFGVLTLPEGRWTPIEGSAPSFSGDGRSFVYVRRAAGGESEIVVAGTDSPAKAAVARRGTERVDHPALSPDGSRVVFQMMPRDDWELYLVNPDGGGERRLTREIQHDLLPRFLTTERVLAVIGEPRHRRSHIYDLPDGTRKRLFHNNTVRTIAPEYAWLASRDGSRLVIAAERDGNTVSPARGVYLTDLSRRVTREELRSRLDANLASELALNDRAQRVYAPIADAVRKVVDQASVARVYGYEKAMYAFDSKHISQPGNDLAAAYLHEMYKSFGYEPQYQRFEASGAHDGQTANVVATLKGTVNPELVYVVSSHYDSVPAGPGADDNSSGTAALLEAARILARHPQPATIVFASFTGEESGLLGSREFVRRATADTLRIVGALNNDMIGWANDHRLDNTIRYSNPGIRDIQHGAAMLFTKLITYDALYYKGTDAAAYYEAYGDIVGGIGSYPILGNPHYHQRHDMLETINHQLVTEVAKTTAATLMLLASSPSRLEGLKVESYRNGTATLSWRPAPEAGVTGYLVAYGPAGKPEAQQVTVRNASAAVSVPPGGVVSVKAINAKGLEGWDGARVTIPNP